TTALVAFASGTSTLHSFLSWATVSLVLSLSGARSAHEQSSAAISPLPTASFADVRCCVASSVSSLSRPLATLLSSSFFSSLSKALSSLSTFDSQPANASTTTRARSMLHAPCPRSARQQPHPPSLSPSVNV